MKGFAKGYPSKLNTFRTQGGNISVFLRRYSMFLPENKLYKSLQKLPLATFCDMGKMSQIFRAARPKEAIAASVLGYTKDLG
ncbi:hypothetical protein AM228_12550 [Planktothricoides sp. SR001]|nr:hypothetical protein AM228_12550 [Planktothricoides sp. SR001]